MDFGNYPTVMNRASRFSLNNGGGIRPKSGGRTINRRKYSEYPKIKKRNSLKDIHFDEVAFATMCLKNEAIKLKKHC